MFLRRVLQIETVLALLLGGLVLYTQDALAWSKQSDIDCTGIFAQIQNEGGDHQYYGYIDLGNDGTKEVEVSGTVTGSNWARVPTVGSYVPPTTFNGTVRVYIEVSHIHVHSGGVLHKHVDDSINRTARIDCRPDYQLNLSHIECVQQGVGGNYVEVHFVLLNVPDGITPEDYVDFTDGVSLWQATRGAHTGNVWHYTAYLPDGYYDIIAAEVDVDGTTVNLHNPHEDAGTYNCTPEVNSASLTVVNDCDGWSVFVTASPGASFSEPSGVWSDPYTLESAPGGTVPVTWPSGTPTQIDLPFPQIDEPQQCLVVLQHSYNITPDVDCDGWDYTLSVPEPTTSIVLLSGQESGSWSNIYVLEDNSGQVPTWRITWADGYVLDVSASTINEPDDCLVTLQHNYDIAMDPSCDGWSMTATVYDGGTYSTSDPLSGNWSDPYSLESATANFHLSWPDGYTQDVSRTVEEPEYCLRYQTSVVVVAGACTYQGGTVYSFSLGEGVTVILEGPNGYNEELSESGQLTLLPGAYTWTAYAAEGYDIVGDSSGSFEVFECPPVPQCPECGPPVWESSNGGMAIVWYSDTPCKVCLIDGVWQVELESRVRIWSEIDFSLEYPAGVFHEPEAVNGADGITYYVLNVDDHVANNAIIWGPSGEADRYREHGQVYKYSACSVAPGFYDAPDGIAVWKPGHTVSDWAKFLLNNGFFPNEQYRGDAALAWANELREKGQLPLPPR